MSDKKTFKYRAHLWHSSLNAEIFVPFEVQAETSEKADSVASDVAEGLADAMGFTSFGATKS